MRSFDTMPLVRVVAAACVALAASCIDEGRGNLFVDFDPSATQATFIEGDDGLRLRLELGVFISSDGEVLLDSALVVVNHDGIATSVPDPDIETEGFPLQSTEQAQIALELPSPISDVTSFDAFCAANGRSADITLRFFTTSIDPDPSQPPPVTEFTTRALLTLPGQPGAPKVFDGHSAVLDTVGAPLVKSVEMGPDDSVLFVNVAPTFPEVTLRGYRADSDSQEGIDLVGLVGYPRLASDDPGVLYIAGPDESGGLRFTRRADDETTFSIERADATPTYDTFNVVALRPTASGLAAAVISAYPLVNPIAGGVDGTPPGDKYYGSFIIEATYAGGVLEPSAFVQPEREIMSWASLAGGLVQATNELPPRAADATLRIELLDGGGAVTWTHDEPVAGYDVDIDTLPDGSVLVAYALATGFVELVRLSATDGTEVARASFRGHHPTIAAYGADNALVSFTGIAPAEVAAAPAREVPLLLELDADMGVLRGAQVACSGTADLQRAEDGSVMLIGAFGQRVTIGAEVTELGPFALILTKVADPL